MPAQGPAPSYKREAGCTLTVAPDAGKARTASGRYRQYNLFTFYLISGADGYGLDSTIYPGAQAVLHLHRFHHRQHLALGDAVTDLAAYIQHQAVHRRAHLAGAGAVGGTLRLVGVVVDGIAVAVPAEPAVVGLVVERHRGADAVDLEHEEVHVLVDDMDDDLLVLDLDGDLVLLVGQRHVHLLLATGEGQRLWAHGGAVPAAQVFLGVLGQGAQHGANGPGGVWQRLY